VFVPSWYGQAEDNFWVRPVHHSNN
jgi:hypothetical protein